VCPEREGFKTLGRAIRTTARPLARSLARFLLLRAPYAASLRTLRALRALRIMKATALASLFLLPVLALASDPSPLRALDGRDLSFLLKRYDGPLAILRSAAKGRKRHIVPRTLQVEEVPVRRGLVERQQCVDAGYVPCTSGTQCCPANYTCGTNVCCPAGTTLMCTGICKNQSRLLRSAHTLILFICLRLPQVAKLAKELAARTLDAAHPVR
jgi:hypothetical protein